MNNELGRKITSLTLMTIMLAGGMTFAAPGMVPAAHAANETLFVSAESSVFENLFGGAQVIEIVVSDPLIASLDDVHGSPDVEVNGNDVILAQASDGSWYAYVADTQMVDAADDSGDTGLEFGFKYTVGIVTQADDVWVNGTVLQGVKTLNSNAGSTNIGQIGLTNDNNWPFIQTYDFNPTGSVVIEYNKAGPNESVELTFDTTDGVATYTQDRTAVPPGAQIHIDIGDPMLNIDPTSTDQWDFDIDGDAFYRNNAEPVPVGDLMFGLNGILITDVNSQGSTVADVLAIEENDNNPDAGNEVDGKFTRVGIFETGANTAIFSTTDDGDASTLRVLPDAVRGLSGTVDYNDTPTSYIVTLEFGEIDMDASSVGDEWNSGEEITVLLKDADINLNSLSDEDLDLNNPDVTLVPSLQIGSPLVLSGTITLSSTTDITATAIVDAFSHIARVDTSSITSTDADRLTIDTGITVADLIDFATNPDTPFVYLNYDIRSLASDIDSVTLHDVGMNYVYPLDLDATQAHIILDEEILLTEIPEGNVHITFDTVPEVDLGDPFVVDFFSFGDRANNAIYRLELEETGDNTGEFIGSVEYIMTNQLNQVQATYDGIVPILDTIAIIVTEDLTDEDGPRINYLDLGEDGVSTQIADQQDAPTHSGVVDLDLDTYKIADTVIVTLTDQDLNTNSDLIDIFVARGSGLVDNEEPADFHLLDITFDDRTYTELGNVDGFVLGETGPATGVFTGSFQIPATFDPGDDHIRTTTGTDIEVNYIDYRDASGETIEVGDGAGVRANTGSISLDRTVYPVPWGELSDFTTITAGNTPSGFSLFPIHATGVVNEFDEPGEQIREGGGDLTIHVRVTDPDLDLSAAGQDVLGLTNSDASGELVGHVKISISRGTDELTLAYAGGNTTSTEKRIVVGSDDFFTARTLGPITEVAGDTGVFELDFGIRYTDGPASTLCPVTNDFTPLNGAADIAGNPDTDRFSVAAETGSYCILQGDILTVEYSDDVDASGNPNSVTDSATFDLRNGVLQSDKSVYIIGSDMIITVIEPDWDLDNDGAETYDLNVIEWDSDAATTTMANENAGIAAAFDPEPSDLRETGDSTGIFQIVIEIPESLAGDNLERGEEIQLEYTDWGPSGARYVGQENEDMNVTIYTSNFGATVELDQKVYTWTDKVYITVVAPDHNFDGQLVDTIGDTNNDPIKVSTRGFDMDRYSLVETGTDTGIFTGEVILTGFEHDSNGDGDESGPTQYTSEDDSGPTDGFLQTSHDDGLTVSFEYSEDSTVVGSALIRWNIGEVQWLEASYPASGTGVVRVIDPDMNLNPEAVDNFNVDTWSDSDAGGISLTVTETNEATGIFEGTVFFTTTNESSGHRLRVAEGDTVTSEYEDNTLPDPYTTADELDVTATTLIGTIVPPLERAPAANLRTVDAFGNSLDDVSVDQQVQISADLANGQDRDQEFAYLVQIQDESGVTVSLAWITGSLEIGQSFSPALSWIPTEAGTYTATAFVWESVDNPTALSPPVSTTISVS